jgi:hypothetical protein
VTRWGPRLAAAILFLVAAAQPAVAGGRTVTGTVSMVDAASGTLTVTDAAGVSWRYRVERDAGIDLAGLRVGDRVAVTIARPTPLNMITAADLLRKGDRVEKTGY